MSIDEKAFNHAVFAADKSFDGQLGKGSSEWAARFIEAYEAARAPVPEQPRKEWGKKLVNGGTEAANYPIGDHQPVGLSQLNRVAKAIEDADVLLDENPEKVDGSYWQHLAKAAIASSAPERGISQPDGLAMALAEIREVWIGSECGEPIHAQEAYAIKLCKEMYQIAVDALAGRTPKREVVDLTFITQFCIDRSGWCLDAKGKAQLSSGIKAVLESFDISVK